MKTTIYTLTTFFLTLTASAQSGTVNIEQDERIPELLEIYQKVQSNLGHYRIQVDFVSSDDRASRLKSRVELDFPEMRVKIDFESPYYRIRVGNYKSRLEAERAFQKIRQKYPKAMILEPKR